MQFLRRLPSPPTAVFSQMLDHEAHVLQIPDPRIRVTEPKTLWKAAHQ